MEQGNSRSISAQCNNHQCTRCARQTHRNPATNNREGRCAMVKIQFIAGTGKRSARERKTYMYSLTRKYGSSSSSFVVNNFVGLDSIIYNPGNVREGCIPQLGPTTILDRCISLGQRISLYLDYFDVSVRLSLIRQANRIPDRS